MPPPVGPCSPVDERLAPGAFSPPVPSAVGESPRGIRHSHHACRHPKRPQRRAAAGRWALLTRSTRGWHPALFSACSTVGVSPRGIHTPQPPTLAAKISSAHLVAAAASCASDPSAHLGKARTATTMDTCAARIAGELTRLHLCALLCPRPCGAGWLMPRLPPSRGRRAGRGGLPSTRRRWGLALASAWRSDSTACSLVRCRPVLWLRRGARRSAEQVECDLQPGGGREVWRRRALPERRRRGICGAGGGDAARCVVVCRPARVWLGGREGG
jgi:hypothetical protein